jgi:hypothetical protein
MTPTATEVAIKDACAYFLDAGRRELRHRHRGVARYETLRGSGAWSAFVNGRPEPTLIDQLDQEEGLKLIKRALAGDASVDAALSELGAVLIFSEAPMPKRLRGYLAFKLLSRQSEGVRPRRALPIRDWYLAGAVAIVAQHGFAPSKASAIGADPRISACAVVAEALARLGIQLSEAEIARSWLKAIQSLWPRGRPKAADQWATREQQGTPVQHKLRGPATCPPQPLKMGVG